MYTGWYNGSQKHEPDLDAVLERSWRSGVDKLIITGGNAQESTKAAAMAQTNDKLYCTVGCHPTRCGEFESHPEGPEAYMSELEQIIAQNRERVLAYGEFGLDYQRLNFCPKDIQLKYFEKQLEACEKLKLPMFLHCRDAAEDLTRILTKFEGRLQGGVVHSFDGTWDEAEKIMGLGYFIGLNGCSLRTPDNLEVVKRLPVNRLMIETDCPWCEIRPSHPGYKLIQTRYDEQYPSVKKEKWKPGSMVKSRNEPCNIVQVLEVIAAVKEMNPVELSTIIYFNTSNMFFSQ
eukprot:TCALIF_10713-PA protein Name:"Similar to tatdn1 Putative deoxyribonuclease TATDN1 (Xenopus laevis)" AED:0.11 eAED:0.11 QI:26/1/0.75/1/1/1/4/34/288